MLLDALQSIAPWFVLGPFPKEHLRIHKNCIYIYIYINVYARCHFSKFCTYAHGIRKIIMIACNNSMICFFNEIYTKAQRNWRCCKNSGKVARETGPKASSWCSCVNLPRPENVAVGHGWPVHKWQQSIRTIGSWPIKFVMTRRMIHMWKERHGKETQTPPGVK